MMPTYEVKNKKTGTVLGRLEVDDPTKVLEALADQTGATIDEIALSFGKNIEEAREALAVDEVEPEPTERQQKKQRKTALSRPSLPPRRFYA